VLKLYDNKESRNGYKVLLLLTQLCTPFEHVGLDLFKGETRTPEYLAKNPFGKIPALELDDGTVLAESGAILWYLAEGTPYLPEGKVARADVLRWMFFEQNMHETSVAEARFIVRHPEIDPSRVEHILPEKQRRGNVALKLMDQHLARNDFFAAGRYTIADIALYAYTSVADQGGFDLAAYPAVQVWLARVAAQPGFIPGSMG
jgi:glutathione S-transferase